jgi:hypothetical protein
MAKKKPRKNTHLRYPLVAADDDNYPLYFVTFDGKLVVDGKIRKNPIVVRGQHSFMLPPLPSNVEVKVVLSRKRADPEIPNLRVTIKRKGT